MALMQLVKKLFNVEAQKCSKLPRFTVHRISDHTRPFRLPFLGAENELKRIADIAFAIDDMINVVTAGTFFADSTYGGSFLALSVPQNP